MSQGHHQFVSDQSNTQMKTLQATGYLRPLNRRTSEHLILGSDGNCYSVDLDAQWGSESSLLNVLGSRLCQTFGIEAAAPVLLKIDPEVSAQGMPGVPSAKEGVFVGKRYPVNPATTAIYDFLPDILLPKVQNRCDFWKLIPIDLWLGNPQASKVLFYRVGTGLNSYRGTTAFRSAPASDENRRTSALPKELPLLSTRHYCGGDGYEDAERTVARLLLMTAFDMEGLFDCLADEGLALVAPAIRQLGQRLLEERGVIFRQFPAMLRATKSRVDAAENDRKGPSTGTACAELVGGIDHSLGATA